MAAGRGWPSALAGRELDGQRLHVPPLEPHTGVLILDESVRRGGEAMAGPKCCLLQAPPAAVVDRRRCRPARAPPAPRRTPRCLGPCWTTWTGRCTIWTWGACGPAACATRVRAEGLGAGSRGTAVGGSWDCQGAASPRTPAELAARWPTSSWCRRAARHPAAVPASRPHCPGRCLPCRRRQRCVVGWAHQALRQPQRAAGEALAAAQGMRIQQRTAIPGCSCTARVRAPCSSARPAAGPQLTPTSRCRPAAPPAPPPRTQSVDGVERLSGIRFLYLDHNALPEAELLRLPGAAGRGAQPCTARHPGGGCMHAGGCEHAGGPRLTLSPRSRCARRGAAAGGAA